MASATLALRTIRIACSAIAPLGRRRCAPYFAAALLCAATCAFAATLYHVEQKNRAFSIDDITIARGDSIAFSNNDEFLHQIYVDSREMDFDSVEQYPGQTITVRFPQAGTFRCAVISIRKCC
jgi:plastocyanin